MVWTTGESRCKMNYIHLTIFFVLKDFQNKKLERKEHIVGSNEKDCGRQDWGQAANCELPRAVLEGARRRGRRGRWFEAKRKHQGQR